ncbi:tetraspanin-15-like [Melitaea cinxia]|uniref:tetraspanin-15-like n=1 Tax=Melitaea cinxia TaxID=113334 RepID=UPI001E270F15|nr:tetraspanin-15-like [Melitaea cinxia]
MCYVNRREIQLYVGVIVKVLRRTYVKEPISEPQSSVTQQNVDGLSLSYGPPTPDNQQQNKHESCCFICIKIYYVLLSIANILLCIAMMAVAVSAAINMKAFSAEQSGKLVALILLAVIATVALSITIYAMIAVAGNHYKHVRGTSVALLLLAIMIAVVIGVSLNIGVEEEVRLSHSLSESFKLSQEDNTRHVKLWTALQNDLTCCGVTGPDDYRYPNQPPIFPPDVPISCCPTFDPDRSHFVQEREKEACKAKRVYFNNGCRDPVIELVRRTSRRVMLISIIVIIVMIWLSIQGAIWTRYCKQHENEPNGTSSKNLSIIGIFTKQQISTKP